MGKSKFKAKFKDNLYEASIEGIKEMRKNLWTNPDEKDEYIDNEEFIEFCNKYAGKIVTIIDEDGDYFEEEDNNWLILPFMFDRI